MQFIVGFAIAWMFKEPIKLVAGQVAKVIKDTLETECKSEDPETPSEE